MKHNKWMIFLLLVTPIFVVGQVSWVPIGSDCWATGGQSAAQISVFGVQNNPASISYLAHLQLGLNQEIRFRQKALMLSSLSVVQPTKWINFGLGLVQQGNTNFNQQKINLSLSKKLSHQFALGVNLTYLATHISETDPLHNYLAELGLFFKPNVKLDIGCFIFNPTQIKYQIAGSEPLPSFIRVGLAYKFSSQLKLLGEYEHSVFVGNIPRLGFEYNPVSSFFLYAGWSLNPQYLTFGSGFQKRNIKISLAMSRHPVLGFTPHFSLTFEFDKKNKK